MSTGAYYPPPAKIPPQVLNTMKVNEFVGYAALPKELRGRRNVAVVGPKKDQARFRSGKSRGKDVRPNSCPNILVADAYTCKSPNLKLL